MTARQLALPFSHLRRPAILATMAVRLTASLFDDLQCPFLSNDSLVLGLSIEASRLPFTMSVWLSASVYGHLWWPTMFRFLAN